MSLTGSWAPQGGAGLEGGRSRESLDKQLLGAGVAAPCGQARLEAVFKFSFQLMMVMNTI